MMVTTPFCRNQKDKTKQQKILGNIPETSHKDETTEDNTDMFDREGQQNRRQHKHF